MFQTIRLSILLFVLLFVVLNTWLSQARSTDWNNSLWIKIYPINADGSEASVKHISTLNTATFSQIEGFIAEETARYGVTIDRPLRVEIGQPVTEQPPVIDPDAGVLGVMIWSLKMRWWASGVTDDQDRIDPDVRVFVRYHDPNFGFLLENSIGLQKGMVGVVNAYASRRNTGSNNVIIAHEFLHTLGATDKYELASGQPSFPDGIAEPDRSPLYPQQLAEIMGGRIALAEDDAVIPKSLKYAIIGPLTAQEIGLTQ